MNLFQCDLEDTEKKDGHISLRILLRFEVNSRERQGLGNIVSLQDNMNRQLNCMISRNSDTPQVLSEELVQHGFIHTNDSCAIQEMLDAAFLKYSDQLAGALNLPADVLVQ